MRFPVSAAVVVISACASKPSGTSVDAPVVAGSNDAAVGDAAVIDSVTPVIPQPTGVCPTIANGDVTFSPAGIPPRKVNLAFDASKVGQGELIFYWYAT